MIKLAVKYVKKEEEQTLRQWLSELNRRRDEVLETFSQEGTPPRAGLPCRNRREDCVDIHRGHAGP